MIALTFLLKVYFAAAGSPVSIQAADLVLAQLRSTYVPAAAAQPIVFASDVEPNDEAGNWVAVYGGKLCLDGKKIPFEGSDGGAADAAKCGSLAARNKDCNPVYVSVRKERPFTSCFCATAGNSCEAQASDPAFVVFQKQTWSIAKCPRCVRLPDRLHLSGSGMMREYYHFMVDFAPVFLNTVRTLPLDDTGCTAVYANGFRMIIEDPERDLHMLDKWDFFFGKPFNVKFEHVEDRLPRECPEVAWKGFGQWATGPGQRFQALREFAFSLAKVSLAPQGKAVLLIKRGRLGAQRRTLPDDFYDLAHQELRKSGIAFDDIELEGLTIEQQVQRFAHAHVVLGQHGAGLSNIMFMQPNTLAVELGFRKFLCYENLAKQVGVNYVAYDTVEWTHAVNNTVVKAVDELIALLRFIESGPSFHQLGEEEERTFMCPTLATTCLKTR